MLNIQDSQRKKKKWGYFLGVAQKIPPYFPLDLRKIPQICDLLNLIALFGGCSQHMDEGDR